MKKLLSIMFFAVVVSALIFSACKNSTSNSGGGNSQSTGETYRIILPKNLQHGTLSSSRSTARKNQEVRITATPDNGYRTNWVKYNETTINPSGDQYIFAMPDDDAIITAEFVQRAGPVDPNAPSYDIFSEGRLNAADEWQPESNGVWGTDIIVDVTIDETAGISAGTTTRAIKIDVKKMHDYFALRIPLEGMGINFKDIDGLTLWAKAGTKTSAHTRYPAINRVAFGDYTNYAWGKSVWYCGENVPTTRYISLDNQWKQITVPVPARIDQEINTLTLFFTEDQVLGQIIYIDRISFIKAESRELVQIVLPEKGSIPYSKNGGSPLASDLERLTRATRFVYAMGDNPESTRNTRYTLYGEDPGDGADAFLNKMSDFYNDIKYFAGDNNQVSGKTYTPSAAGATFNLSVSYGNKSSLNNVMPNGAISPSRMNITVKGLPAAASGGNLVIDDFNNVQTENNGGKIHVQIPYYWGGTSGDAQSYGDKVIYCWVDNILQNPMPLLDTGIPLDNWFVFGNMEVNLDLTGTSKIVIGAKLLRDVKYTFTLLSGYTGVNSTLTLNPENGKYEKRAKQITMVGKGFTGFQTYEFTLASFQGDPDFDPANITAYEFETDAVLNAGNENAFTLVGTGSDGKPEGPCWLQINGIRATN